MKRFISIFLIMVLLLTGCSSKNTNTSEIAVTADSSVASNDTGKEVIDDNVTNTNSIEDENQSKIESFSGLDDPDLLRYMEDDVYTKLIDDLDSNEYFVENVTAIYLSKEYIEELQYNSQSNIYFGYTLSELDEVFQGKKYVFTLGDDNTTVVKEMEVIEETSYYEMLKNVAIGTGVILFCVTVSVVTAGSAPAVSLIFAASAKTATSFAVSGALISGAATGIITGIQTGNLNAGLDAGLMAASEEFKWGAITGAVAGGVAEGAKLYGATRNGLTMNQAARIQRESKWPLNAIKSMHSEEEYQIYKNAKLIPTKLDDGSYVFMRDIDWNIVDSKGRTNIERVAAKLAPIDATGKSYELHHIGMKADGPLAILTYAEHHAKENYSILHWADTGKDIADAEWAIQKNAIWKKLSQMAGSGGVL